MSEKLPPALREALYESLRNEDFAWLPNKVTRRDRARCMAAALRWAYEQGAIWGDELALREAADALEQEAR